MRLWTGRGSLKLAGKAHPVPSGPSAPQRNISKAHLALFIWCFGQDRQDVAGIPKLLSQRHCEQSTPRTVFYGSYLVPPNHETLLEKEKSRAPPPCPQQCPTPAGNRITLVSTSVPSPSCLLPEQGWRPGLHLRAGASSRGNGATGRGVKRQRGLNPSWTGGSTHGSRPSGTQAHCSYLLS